VNSQHAASGNYDLQLSSPRAETSIQAIVNAGGDATGTESIAGVTPAARAATAHMKSAQQPLAPTAISKRTAISPRMSAAASVVQPFCTRIAAMSRWAIKAFNTKVLGITFKLWALIALVVFYAVRSLNRPSRVYNREANTVGREYDAWTSEGILEYYWGEHIHLGYYGENERRGPFYGGKNFIEAKYDFIDKMLEFSQVKEPVKVLDVGCGIGGTSRYLAKKFPAAEVTGITISNEQQQRATALATERGVSNAKFEICDALNMKYEDNTFDFVWACESGEHMPDKEQYVKEMTRVLKPGGRIVIATWCQREEPPAFSASERKTLDYLYGEWTHPYFISIEEYGRIMERTGKLSGITTDDWAAQTIPAWRQSVWVGVWDPWPVIRRPRLWWKVIRDAWCLEVMHRAFTNGLMRYGMMTAGKPAA
jgi:MPBQ/MSBQ methyltransferase